MIFQSISFAQFTWTCQKSILESFSFLQMDKQEAFCKLGVNLKWALWCQDKTVFIIFMLTLNLAPHCPFKSCFSLRRGQFCICISLQANFSSLTINYERKRKSIFKTSIFYFSRQNHTELGHGDSLARQPNRNYVTSNVLQRYMSFSHKIQDKRS